MSEPRHWSSSVRGFGRIFPRAMVSRAGPLGYPFTPAGRWLVCFVLLLVWFHDSLWTAPTGDQASGVWFEGIFLSETRYDYNRLRYQEQTPAQGGASVYVHSVVPTLIALLFDAVGSPRWVFFVSHIFTIFCASLLVWMLFESLAPVVSKGTAALACALLVSLPPFGLQIALLGMEIPMTSFAFCSAVLASRERYLSSAACAFVACAMKISALAVVLAVAIVLGARAATLFLRRERGSSWRALGGALMLFVVFGAWLEIQAHWRMNHLEFRPVFTATP